ncbi:M20 metallopeptidase family protein [Moorella sulfitireducens]|uniref:M20 metallopeptidase family protein n=1 Tax=Neomoorella sulfitireducens TaxID=2972948 RepID=UPI0021AC9503|nr:amidohydrolase [Moorella sulfitireducens]
MEHLLEASHALLPTLKAWRRDFHRYPELAYQEYKTAHKISSALQSVGIEVYSGLAGTGVIGILRGEGPGPNIAFRADMDALPLEEQNQINYKSENPGIMHACGHDGHIAILLGAATLLAQRRRELKGKVVFIFQPAEEALPAGGANRLVAEAGELIFPLDYIFGFHLWPELPAGKIAAPVGPVMAAGDIFQVEVLGKGGHGANPHKAVDAVLLASQMVVSLQNILARQVDPHQAAVLSVGVINGGKSPNVLPAKVLLKGTTRYFEPSLQEFFAQRIRQVLHGLALANGGDFYFEYQQGYKVTVNEKEATELVRACAARLVGEENVITQVVPSLATEDFSVYLQMVPGCYFWLGAGNAGKELNYPLHNPRFNFDEEVLVTGVALLVNLARSTMGN